MCFDRSGGHALPAARHLFPDSAGRSVRLFRFSSRLGQRGIAPLCAHPLDEPRRQVEIAERHVPHAVGVQQRRRVLPEHRPEGARGRREAERAAGLGVHVRHGQRQVDRGQAKGRGAHAEGDPRAGIARDTRQKGRGGGGEAEVDAAQGDREDGARRVRRDASLHGIPAGALAPD